MQATKPMSARCGSRQVRGAPRAFSSPRPAVHSKALQHDDSSDASRRQLLASSLVLSGLAILPGTARAEEAIIEASELIAPDELMAPRPNPAASTSGKLSELLDETLAYKFQYPVSTMSGKPLRMTLSHPPEKYSSAAPLTADARQRIVCEYIDFSNFVTVSMTVGPASGVLKGVEPTQWKPYDVALTVLIDRSTSRLTTGQRMSLNDVERAEAEVRDDGGRYIVYEHLSQGSPTLLENERKETYRHALAVTAMRPDSQGMPYLYTLNMSCRQAMWDDLQPLFTEAVNNFRLLPPTRNYISPDTNPWQFW